jgi:hypothetical protein
MWLRYGDSSEIQRKGKPAVGSWYQRSGEETVDGLFCAVVKDGV